MLTFPHLGGRQIILSFAMKTRIRIKIFYTYAGEGLRYELQEFISCINNGLSNTHRLTYTEMITMAGIIEKFRTGEHIELL